MVYAAVRAYHDYPAQDRSHDTHPADALAGLTAGLDDRRDVLLTDLDWQSQNGLTYFAQYERPELAYARVADVQLYLPQFLADNAAISRNVVASSRAASTLSDQYGPLISVTPDSRTSAASLTAALESVPRETRYVFCVLKPGRDFAIDWADVGQSLAALGNGQTVLVPDGDYVAIAGITGSAPSITLASNDPFDRSFDLGGVPVEVRMESWLASDTIRRMGYGHVVANRSHSLVVERGVSVVAFAPSGLPLARAYAANIFAPERRYLIQWSAPGS